MNASNQMIFKEIERLRRERDAVILAHNYQLPEVQGLADHCGDSLALARLAADTGAGVIVLCGVRFMAETAALISPERTVLLPILEAGCPLAEMLTAGQVREVRERFPAVYVITYVNSTAEVKAESDICCTSSNAVKVLAQAPADRPVFFGPDRHLGEFAARELGLESALYPEAAPVMLWPGFCPTHHRLTATDVAEARVLHPEARVMVHPECDLSVVDAADIAASTGGMLDYPDSVDADEFIVGTEVGMLTPLRRRFPHKRFHPLSPEKTVCYNMKMITAESVLRSLETLTPVVEVEVDVASRARRSIENMLNIS